MRGSGATRALASIRSLVRGGTYLYLSSIVNNITGYVYWLLISAIAGPEVLGVTSAVIGLSAIINGSLSLGIGAALQRHIGVCIGKHDKECAARYYWTSLLFSLITYPTVALILYVMGASGVGIANYEPGMLKAASALVLLGFNMVPISYALTRLRTDLLLIAAVGGNIFKILLGATLVWLGYGWAGAVAGYFMVSLAQLLVTLPYSLRDIGIGIRLSLEALIDTLKAGVVNWLPWIIAFLGQWLGVLAVYGYTGAVETGHYYVAYIIAGFTMGVSTIVVGVLLPVLSSMPDGRKRLASNATRIGLALITPIVAFIAVYPQVPLSLLGEEYTQAANTLRILVIGAIPMLITAVIGNLIYAYGLYAQRLALGLAQTIPRILLYLTLTPKLGGLGVAIAMTTGSLTGLTYAVYAGTRAGYKLDVDTITRVLPAPLAVALACISLGMPWPIGLAVYTLLYPLYVRLGVITRRDVKEIVRAFVSDEKLYVAYRKFKIIIDHIFPEQ